MKYAQSLQLARAVVSQAAYRGPMATQITVYGADWCGDTSMTRAQLKKLGVKFAYVNIDKDPAGAEWVRDHNGGKQKLPTVDVGGKILSIPDDVDLEAALKAARVLPA